ncbi:MAG: UDP-N-acetylglucosamine 2-epimerase (non-hydrolyzing) [Bacteroidia bacterium]
MKKIISVVGARPNFIKVAPLHKAFVKNHSQKVQHLICHTGQHFDKKMSDIFFEQLGLPKPHFHLGISGGSHAQQVAQIMMAFEEVLLKEKPDLVLVVGDVNSTMACTVVASKLQIQVAHVEAGLRSFDRTMPEEINRMVTDVLADYLFVTEPSGMKNLANEGISDEKVFFTGNVMIDSLVALTPKIDASEIFDQLNIKQGDYILGTFHRPANVDDPEFLQKLVTTLNYLAKFKKLIFPAHPRTTKHMKANGLYDKLDKNVILTEPIGYIDFLALVKHADLIVTDSGGIQEESTFLGVQCITVRDNTERPVTVDLGTNQLIGTNLDAVKKAAEGVLSGNRKSGRVPELWDGEAAGRITEILVNVLTGNAKPANSTVRV